MPSCFKKVDKMGAKMDRLVTEIAVLEGLGCPGAN
jgi:predicted metal-binding protein